MDSGFFWPLGTSSYKVIGLSELGMDPCIILLTNECITTALQNHYPRKVKLEVDDVLVFSDLDEDSIQEVDIVGTSSYPFQSPCFFTSTSFGQAMPGNDSLPLQTIEFEYFLIIHTLQNTSCSSYVIHI